MDKVSIRKPVYRTLNNNFAYIYAGYLVGFFSVPRHQSTINPFSLSAPSLTSPFSPIGPQNIAPSAPLDIHLDQDGLKMSDLMEA